MCSQFAVRLRTDFYKAENSYRRRKISHSAAKNKADEHASARPLFLLEALYKNYSLGFEVKRESTNSCANVLTRRSAVPIAKLPKTSP